MRYYSSSSDFYYDTTASTLNYYISVNGETIYNGKAVKSPSKDAISINVGKRVRDYIRISMPDFSDYDGVVVPHPEAMLVFNLYDSQSGSILEQYNVRLDDTKEWGGEEGCLSEPINTHADPRQKIFYGHSSSGESSVDIESVVPNPTIIFDSPFSFGWESGVTTICYTANTDFTLSSYSGGWYTVTQAKADEFTGCLTFTYSENEERSGRDGTMCMQATGGFVECFPVYQSPYAGGYDRQYLTFDVISGGTIHWIDNTDCVYYLNYSFDEGRTWREALDSPCTLKVNAGDRVMFKGHSSSCITEPRFEGSTAYFNLEGNVQSLFHPSNFRQEPTPHKLRYCFSGTRVVSAENLVLPVGTSVQCYELMFAGCESLTTPPVLPAKVLSDECYSEMFLNCSNLRYAPELPATAMTKECYYQMFAGCNALKIPPELPATKLANKCYNSMFASSGLEVAPALPATKLAGYCYASMFGGCKITTAPVLPATAMAPGCYRNMFGGCVNLTEPPVLPATTLAYECYAYMLGSCKITTAPELPATTMAESCYLSMFSNCSNLTGATDLPATTLAKGCYSGMFRGCTSLVTPPVMSATIVAENCCQSMFRGCTSLTTAPALPATKMKSGCYNGMFYGCTSLTTAPTLPALTLAVSCYNGMFAGCTSLASPPQLPASTLAPSCYATMFAGCTSITSAPYLRATTLTTQCYYYMFSGCSSLRYAECSATSRGEASVYGWMTNVSRTGTFVKAASASFWPRNENGIPTGWTVMDGA